MEQMSKTALVVDDSVTLRKMVSLVLTEQGFTVLEAANGREALEKLPLGGVTLVVTDINMPEMDGIEFVKALRMRATYRFVPVVILTTEFGAKPQDAARAAGASAWVRKPFDHDKLSGVVRKLVH